MSKIYQLSAINKTAPWFLLIDPPSSHETFKLSNRNSQITLYKYCKQHHLSHLQVVCFPGCFYLLWLVADEDVERWRAASHPLSAVSFSSFCQSGAGPEVITQHPLHHHHHSSLHCIPFKSKYLILCQKSVLRSHTFKGAQKLCPCLERERSIMSMMKRPWSVTSPSVMPTQNVFKAVPLCIFILVFTLHCIVAHFSIVAQFECQIVFLWQRFARLASQPVWNLSSTHLENWKEW